MANRYINMWGFFSIFSFNSNVLRLTHAHLVTHYCLPGPLLQCYCQARLYLPNTCWNIYSYLEGTVCCIGVYQSVLNFFSAFLHIVRIMLNFKLLPLWLSSLKWNGQRKKIQWNLLMQIAAARNPHLQDVRLWWEFWTAIIKMGIQRQIWSSGQNDKICSSEMLWMTNQD